MKEPENVVANHGRVAVAIVALALAVVPFDGQAVPKVQVEVAD